MSRLTAATGMLTTANNTVDTTHQAPLHSAVPRGPSRTAVVCDARVTVLDDVLHGVEGVLGDAPGHQSQRGGPRRLLLEGERHDDQRPSAYAALLSEKTTA